MSLLITNESQLLSVINVLKTHVVCNACSKIFSKPVKLNCNHIFCQSCLSKNECSICREQYKTLEQADEFVDLGNLIKKTVETFETMIKDADLKPVNCAPIIPMSANNEKNCETLYDEMTGRTPPKTYSNRTDSLSTVTVNCAKLPLRKSTKLCTDSDDHNYEINHKKCISDKKSKFDNVLDIKIQKLNGQLLNKKVLTTDSVYLDAKPNIEETDSVPQAQDTSNYTKVNTRLSSKKISKAADVSNKRKSSLKIMSTRSKKQKLNENGKKVDPCTVILNNNDCVEVAVKAKRVRNNKTAKDSVLNIENNPLMGESNKSKDQLQDKEFLKLSCNDSGTNHDSIEVLIGSGDKSEISVITSEVPISTLEKEETRSSMSRSIFQQSITSMDIFSNDALNDESEIKYEHKLIQTVYQLKHKIIQTDKEVVDDNWEFLLRNFFITFENILNYEHNISYPETELNEFIRKHSDMCFLPMVREFKKISSNVNFIKNLFDKCEEKICILNNDYNDDQLYKEIGIQTEECTERRGFTISSNEEFKTPKKVDVFTQTNDNSTFTFTSEPRNLDDGKEEIDQACIYHPPGSDDNSNAECTSNSEESQLIISLHNPTNTGQCYQNAKLINSNNAGESKHFAYNKEEFLFNVYSEKEPNNINQVYHHVDEMLINFDEVKNNENVNNEEEAKNEGNHYIIIDSDSEDPNIIEGTEDVLSNNKKEQLSKLMNAKFYMDNEASVRNEVTSANDVSSKKQDPMTISTCTGDDKVRILQNIKICSPTTIYIDESDEDIVPGTPEHTLCSSTMEISHIDDIDDDDDKDQEFIISPPTDFADDEFEEISSIKENDDELKQTHIKNVCDSKFDLFSQQSLIMSNFRHDKSRKSFFDTTIKQPQNISKAKRLTELPILKEQSQNKLNLSLNTSDVYGKTSQRSKMLPVVSATRLTKDEMTKIAVLQNKGLITYASTFSDKITHMIVKTTEENHLQDHTIKYVLSVAAGIWILNINWLEACLKQNFIVDEEPYEVFDLSGRPGPKLSRLTKTNRNLFENFRVHAAPPFYCTKKEEVEHVIKMLGGEIADSLDDLQIESDKTKLIISEASETEDINLYNGWLDKFGVITVDLEWLSHSVGEFRILSCKPYLLCETNATFEADSTLLRDDDEDDD